MPPGWTCSSATGSPPPRRAVIAAAAGRNARTTTPPSWGWAPRIACGSACSRRTRRSRSAAVAMGMTALCLPCGGAAQPRNALRVVLVRLVVGGLLVGFLVRELLALVVVTHRVADAVHVGLFSLLHAVNVAAVIVVPSAGAMACGVAIPNRQHRSRPRRRAVAGAAWPAPSSC